MNNQPLRLSDKEVQQWALSRPKSTPAQLSKAYGITYELLQNVIDGWLDSSDKSVVNLAAEICVQNYIKAKRNGEELNILTLCKAIESLRENLFSTKFGASLRANRVLGNVLDEYAQRKITININLDKSAIDAIRKAAELDGDVIIDVESNDNIPENGGNEDKREERPLLLGYPNPGIYKNDGQGICITQEIGGQMPGETSETN